MMRRTEVHRWGDAHLPSFLPSGSTQAPLIARLEPRESELGARRDQVITSIETVLQELSRDRNADRMHPAIHWTSVTAPVTKETGQRVMTAWR